VAISRRAAPLDLGVALPGEEGRRTLGGHLRRWLPIAIGLLMAAAMILLAAAAPLIAPLSPSAQYADAVLKGPGAVERHLLGTDEFGRDVLSRIIWGARVSLQVGLASVIWGFLLGVPLGILAGTHGGALETAIMRGADMLMAFPTLLLALIIVHRTRWHAGERDHGDRDRAHAQLRAAGAQPGPDHPRARLHHGRAGPGQRAAPRDGPPRPSRTRSTRWWWWPRSTSRPRSGPRPACPSWAWASRHPTPSWGNILSEGRQYIKCCPWITTFSGLAIMLAVLAFNLVGDALRDLLDPRLRGE